jgi:hypothetical protein
MIVMLYKLGGRNTPFTYHGEIYPDNAIGPFRLTRLIPQNNDSATFMGDEEFNAVRTHLSTLVEGVELLAA